MPDGNSIAADIPRVVAKLREGYDLVIASRYAPGAKSEDDDWLTGIGNGLFTGIVNATVSGPMNNGLVRCTFGPGNRLASIMRLRWRSWSVPKLAAVRIAVVRLP